VTKTLDTPAQRRSGRSDSLEGVKIPREHPRIYFRRADLERMRRQSKRSPFREYIESLKKQFASIPPGQVPTGEEVHARVTGILAMTDPEKRQQQLLGMKGYFRSITVRLDPGALLYRLTGEKRYLDEARQVLLGMAAMRAEDTTYNSYHGYHALIRPMATALDFLWDELDAAERRTVCGALRARVSEFHEHTLRHAYVDPYESHAIVYGPSGVIPSILALYHHELETEEWLKDTLAYARDKFPAFGGDDGGWSQGFGYIHSHAFLDMAELLRIGAGVDLYGLPWAREHGNFLLYFLPPGGECYTFGDVGRSSAGSLHKSVMEAFAAQYQNPYFQWYADQIEAPISSATFSISARLQRKQPRAKAPSDLPLSVHLRDIGWIAMHTDLVRRKNDVMLQFKCSRFGSFNHSHADQNSFTLDAFGRPLLIDSGYYPWFGSKHDVCWSRQTRAHNAVLVNGKGQGIFNMEASGWVDAFVTGRDFDYCRGDATRAYQAKTLNESPRELSAEHEGVVRMVRHIVFVRPNAFVILDEVETEQPRPVQFMLHGIRPFKVERSSRRAKIANGVARATIHFLEPGAVSVTQADEFSHPPEHPGHANFPGYAQQWHLKASYDAGAAKRKLLTVIVVERTDKKAAAPKVSRIDGLNTVGAKIGDTTVEFRIDNDGLRVRGLTAGRKPAWFEHSEGRDIFLKDPIGFDR